MITVFHHSKLTFQDYRQLTWYITQVENLKLLEGHPEFGTSQWCFETYKPERVKQLYQNVPKPHEEHGLKEAYEKEVGLAMLFKGDYHHPLQVPLTSNVDLEALMEDWCRDYVDTHEWVLQDPKEQAAFSPGEES